MKLSNRKEASKELEVENVYREQRREMRTM